MDMLIDSLVPPPSDSHSAPASYHAKCGTSAPTLESSHGKQLQQQQGDDAAEWSRSSWDMPVNGTPLSCANAVTPAFLGHHHDQSEMTPINLQFMMATLATCTISISVHFTQTRA